MESHKVIFQPDGEQIEVPSGTKLLDAAAEAGVSVNSLCGGEGGCGQCRVRSLSGKADPGSHSIRFLKHVEIQEGFVIESGREHG